MNSSVQDAVSVVAILESDSFDPCAQPAVQSCMEALASGEIAGASVTPVQLHRRAPPRRRRDAEHQHAVTEARVLPACREVAGARR